MTMKSKAILSLLSAFFLGFALNFILVYFSIIGHQHPQKNMHRGTADLINTFTKELSLDSTQVAELKRHLEVVRVHHDSLRTVMEEMNRSIREEFRTSFARTLNPVQQETFKEFNRRRDEKYKR